MVDKPVTAAGYRVEHGALVRATCLYLATKLGDLMDDLVVVGGLVPSLLIEQDTLPSGTPAHVGTMDLDLGLTLGLLDSGRYRTLAEALRRSGCAPDTNDRGHRTRQRWRVGSAEGATVDFLIQPSQPQDRGGRLRDLEADLAAVIAPGLHLAFRDRQQVMLSGSTIHGEQAARAIWVCGPGAYVVLKALAFDGAISSTTRAWVRGAWPASSPEVPTMPYRLTWWASSTRSCVRQVCDQDGVTPETDGLAPESFRPRHALARARSPH